MPRAVALLLACMLVTIPVDAQSGSPWSIQVSGMAQKFKGGDPGSTFGPDISWGLGGEIQARWTPVWFSIGVGLQYAHISDIDAFRFDGGNAGNAISATVIGPFVEPRAVIGSFGDLAAPYASVRFGLIRVGYSDRLAIGYGHSWSQYINGGGGLIFRLGRRSNLDIGASAGIDDSGDPDVIVRVGLSFGVGQ